MLTLNTVPNRLPVDYILNQLNTLSKLTASLFKVHFNIILFSAMSLKHSRTTEKEMNQNHIIE